jgi:hypothetical protein
LRFAQVRPDPLSTDADSARCSRNSSASFFFEPKRGLIVDRTIMFGEA